MRRPYGVEVYEDRTFVEKQRFRTLREATRYAERMARCGYEARVVDENDYYIATYA